MGIAQEMGNLPPGVQDLFDRVPAEYMRDLAIDLAQAALIAPRRPDALYQLVREWEATLEEIDLSGESLPDILRAREEAQAGIGMMPDELRKESDDDDQ